MGDLNLMEIPVKDDRSTDPVPSTSVRKPRPTDILGQRRSLIDLENLVQEMTTQHEEELMALQNAMKRHEAEIQKKLSEKEQEYDMMLGRLEESRTARECTLREFNTLSDKFDDMERYFKAEMARVTQDAKGFKEAFEEVQNSKAELSAKEMEQTERLIGEVNRLREDKSQMLVEIEQKDRDARYRERILNSKSTKLVDTQRDLDQAREDLDQIQSELLTLREFRASWAESQQVVGDKSKRIEELEKKVSSLNASKDKLKQTLIVLDEQLKEFEGIVVDKNVEVASLQEQKSKLESDNFQLRQLVREAQAEFESMKKLKAVVDEKLIKMESAFETIEVERDSRVVQLQSQVAELTTSNEELEEQFEEVLARNQGLETADQHFRSCIEALRIECSDHRDENTVVVNQYVKEKNANTEYEAEIQKMKAANEELSNTLESLQEQMAVLEFEKNEIDVRMKTVLKQQIKLIEYLQRENEILTVKKPSKTFLGRILGTGGRDKDKDKEPMVQSPYVLKQATLPAKFKETPSCVLREQNIVRYLEGEAEKLRQQLNSCKGNQDPDLGDKENNVMKSVRKSSETQTLPVSPPLGLSSDSDRSSDQDQDQEDSDLDSALAAMALAVDDQSIDPDSEDLSGYERDLYFAEQAKRARHGHRGQGDDFGETDTDDYS